MVEHEKRTVRTPEEELAEIWKDYENGVMYQEKAGLSRNLPMFVRFFEGNQWAAPTARTKNMPRPVINIIRMICRNKKSAILSAPVRLVYTSSDQDVAVEKFNRFAEYIQKELGQEALDKEAIDHGVKKGCYIYHYFWDADAYSGIGQTDGALRCEIIDPLNIFFAKPTERDEQKQKWVMIVSREEVSSLRAKCDPDIDPENIRPDDSESKYGETEQDGSELCTVLTRYFRRNGEVYCEKATKSSFVQKPFPIAPDIDAARRSLGIAPDAPNNATPDDATRDTALPRALRAPLYPIVVGNYELREKSIYGLGEVEGLIGVQKAVNLIYALSVMNTQEYAWGKYVVHPNALQGQRISGEPGQVLIDHTRTGQGIRKMTEQAISTVPMQQVESLIGLLRSVSGATEVMSGEAIGANMSGSAIAQLQAQAQAPAEELRDFFWTAKRKQGLVLAQFFKLFYHNTEFVYEEERQAPDVGNHQAPGAARTEWRIVKDVFSGREYENAVFDVVVEAVSGSRASNVSDINMLETLFAKGAIDLQTFLRAYPDSAISNKSELLKSIEETQAGENAQLRGAVEQLQQELAAATEKIKADEKSVEAAETLVAENQSLKKAYVEMATAYNSLITEATAKITEANRQIELGNAAREELQTDATDFAAELLQRRGVNADQVSPQEEVRTAVPGQAGSTASPNGR